MRGGLGDVDQKREGANSSLSLRGRRAPLLVGDKPTLAPAVRWVINLQTNKSGLVATALELNIGQRVPRTCARPGRQGNPQGRRPPARVLGSRRGPCTFLFFSLQTPSIFSLSPRLLAQQKTNRTIE